MSSALVYAPDSAPTGAPNGASVADLQQRGFVPLAQSGYWAAPEALRDEAQFLTALQALQENASPLEFAEDWLAAHKQELITAANARIDAVELDEQLNAVFGMLERRQVLSTITGPPGAAKSTVASLWAKTARMAYPTLPLVVITQERPALQRLCDKINADDAAEFTVDEALSPETDWPENAAIIIDEAGLFGTSVMAQLLQRSANAKAAKIILIGDDRQLGSNHAGQPFRWLCQQDRCDSIVLSHPFRQKNPELRTAVQHLYQGRIGEALALIPCHFPAQAALAKKIRALLDHTTPEKTMIVVHGPLYLHERLRNCCAGFRIFPLATAQGLAVDGVILVLAQKTDSAELLVGCSRQRFTLDVVADQDVYKDRAAIAQNIGDFPKDLMALDVVGADVVLGLVG
ncbi:MAG: hypothetical protein JWM96_329 [Alphaproteobacteria bacterium]|nr:hypothetical protein [Alphaproteobacteria bacterium]